MKIQYESNNFKDASLATIETANSILSEYEGQGYTLTLRQLYYQFVARALIENSERSYKNLGKLISKARLAGMVDWYAIEDRTRTAYGNHYQPDELEVLDGLEYGLSYDPWQNQDIYAEIWVEKEALFNVIERPARRYEVTHMACKGYLSQSEAWRAGRRFKRQHQDGKACKLIHLGDHDPSGIDMTRDNDDRLSMFAEAYDIEIVRLALNMDQVDQYGPPPNPTKITDSRSGDYIARFGQTSWELDALEPAVIANLIDEQLEDWIDWVEWDEVKDAESAARERLAKIHGNWQYISSVLDELE